MHVNPDANLSTAVHASSQSMTPWQKEVNSKKNEQNVFSFEKTGAHCDDITQWSLKLKHDWIK